MKGTVWINEERLKDKIMGCWIGKNAGGTLGEPLEEKFGRRELFQVDWYPELPEGGIPNDDLELQLIWLQLLQEKGPGIEAEDFVEAWLDCIAYNFDEYGLSKENMMKGLLPPVTGWHNNAFRDCMGSPIRSEIWACVAPGKPALAAHYAYMDAIVDHGGGESVYGEIFNAVVESAAFVLDDKFRLLELGLAAIPKESLTYQAVDQALQNYRCGMSYEENRNQVLDQFYHPVAQYSPVNLGFQTIGWLYGEDFGDAICKAVNCGWDTDCTAATLGAVLGIIGGASSLPQKWTEPLGDEIMTNVGTGGIRNLRAPTNIRVLTDQVYEEAVRMLHYWNYQVVWDRQSEAVRVETLEPPNRELLKAKKSNRISYRLGGFQVDVAYERHAAILGDEPSKFRLSIANHHPISRKVTLKAVLPEGFSVEIEEKCEKDSVKKSGAEAPGERWLEQQEITVNMAAGERKDMFCTVSAAAEAIGGKNCIYFILDIQEQNAVPAIPVALTGGYCYWISPLYEGCRLEEPGIVSRILEENLLECGEELWRSGNDLEIGKLFAKPGVRAVLHKVFNRREREVVLGVPNNGRMQLYLNGTFLHETHEVVPLRPNLGNGGALGDSSNYKTAVLKKGWNDIIILLEQEGRNAEAHFTMGELSTVCAKNHGMPVMEVCRTGYEGPEERLRSVT